MRFRDFLTEVKCLIESGETRAKNIWIEKFPNNITRIYFVMGDNATNELFAVEIKKITSNDVEFPKDLKQKDVIYVGFGNVLDNDILNTKQIKRKNSAGLKIISSVRNIISDYVKQMNIDIIIFSAKDIDGAFSKRVGAYDLIARASAKDQGFLLKRLDDKKGVFFILSKDQISSSSYKDIENILIPKITFMDKIKK